MRLPKSLRGPAEVDACRLQQSRILNPSIRDLRELVQLVDLSLARSDDVPYEDIPCGQGVGQQLAVTPPPNRLGAHDRGRPHRKVEQGRDSGPELSGLHVIRMAPETPVAPCGVDGIRPGIPHATKRREMAVDTPVRRKERVQHVFVELRMPPRLRYGSHVGNLLDPVCLEKSNELVRTAGRMTDCPDRRRGAHELTTN